MSLKIGDYFHYSYDNSIGIYKGHSEFSKCIVLNSKIYDSYRKYSFSQGVLQLANPQQIAHLEACIKANKYVELDSINNEIEIMLW
jgi:hypothetical protein